MTSACDVLVAGAGPAGMAAAASAAQSGTRVLLLDDNPSPGGQIWRGHATTPSAQPQSSPYSRLAARLRHPNIRIQSGARIVLAPSPHTVRVETETEHHDIHYERLILATGARELFLPFPGWTLPGVLGAGGLQSLVKSGLPITGKRVVLSGSGPLLLAVAAHLCKQGALIAGIFEQAPLARFIRFGLQLVGRPRKLAEAFAYRSTFTSHCTSSWVVRAHGDQQLRSVLVSVRGTHREIPCDYLACGFHLVPNLELPRLLSCRIADNAVAIDSTQQTSIPHVYCAGELTGVGGLDKALVEGEIAGLSAAGKSAAHLYAARDRHARFARALSQAFAPRVELRSLAEPSTLVCRCEDVPHSALVDLRSTREAKLHTRCGMGPCQGRICGSAAQFLYGWQPDNTRPPLTPARIETLTARHHV